MPTTPTGDIFCDVEFSVTKSTRLTPTWYQVSHEHESTYNNAGVIHIDVYGLVKVGGDYSTGCAPDTLGLSLDENDKINVCTGKIPDSVNHASARDLCASGWHVCSGPDMEKLSTDYSDIVGCYMVNAQLCGNTCNDNCDSDCNSSSNILTIGANCPVLFGSSTCSGHSEYLIGSNTANEKCTPMFEGNYDGVACCLGSECSSYTD
eukprot:UN31586